MVWRTSIKMIASVAAIISGIYYFKTNQKDFAEKIAPPPMTDLEKEWEPYYQNTRSGTQIESVYTRVILALQNEHPNKKFKALDLGTGAGVVALKIASSGRNENDECTFEVIAEDINCNALEIVNQRAAEAGVKQCIQTRQRDISKKPAADSQYDLITARAVIPFLPKEIPTQQIIDDNITQQLAPEGRAIVEFFGPKHPWCVEKRCHTRTEVETFFSRFERIEILESSDPINLAEGTQSVWDEITVVAYK